MIIMCGTALALDIRVALVWVTATRAFAEPMSLFIKHSVVLAGLPVAYLAWLAGHNSTSADVDDLALTQVPADAPTAMHTRTVVRRE